MEEIKIKLGTLKNLNLTEEQRARIKTCKDMNEFNAILAETGAELPDEILNHVSGGDIIHRLDEYILVDENDGDCEKGRYKTFWEACDAAHDYNITHDYNIKTHLRS